MSRNTAQDSRKKLFVNRSIQGTIMRQFALCWVVYHVLLWHVLLFAHVLQNQVTMVNGEAPLDFQGIYFSLFQQYFPIILAAVAVLPILALDVLKLSHRIVGPFVQFANSLRKLRNGEQVEPIRLRKNDLPVELQNEFNEFITWFNESQARKQQPTLSEQLSSAASDQTEQEVLQDLADLKKTTEGIRASDEDPSTPVIGQTDEN